jgi:hypothetical protein
MIKPIASATIRRFSFALALLSLAMVPVSSATQADRDPEPYEHLATVVEPVDGLADIEVGQAPNSRDEPELTLLSAAKNPVLKRMFEKQKGKFVYDVHPNGAISVNAEWEAGKSPKWFIEQQRYGADLIEAGIVLDEEARFREGLLVIRWGLQRQGEDGGFPGTGDPFHSTSFFVEAFARSILLLKQSGRDPSTIDAKSVQKLKAAAEWLMKPEVARRGENNNIPYTHRRWLLAAALGESAAVTGDRAMALAAERYAHEGLGLQTEEGINPEKGGGDVNYQAAGILFAARYYTVCTDAALRGRIRTMIEKGLRWELTNVDSHGDVSDATSTRAGKEKGRSGAVKKIDYKVIIEVFTFGSAITGDATFEKIAAKIDLEREKRKP